MIPTVRSRAIGTSSGHPKRLALGILMCVLFAFVHFLLELLRLLLVGEGQAGETLLEFEGVEESAVLIVREGVVDLLVPNDAAVQGLAQS